MIARIHTVESETGDRGGRIEEGAFDNVYKRIVIVQNGNHSVVEGKLRLTL